MHFDKDLDKTKIDDAVLALLLLGIHDGRRAWKGFDWDALDRLYRKGYISNPRGRAKSVAFSDKGIKRAERLLALLFGTPEVAASVDMSDEEPEHDPFNEPEQAHPRARELMTEPFFWDCVDEEAPFGSDEGHDAYYEFRRWRESHKDENLTECFAWIMKGESLDNYNQDLCTDEAVERDVEHPEDAFLADEFDINTLDVTIIATALGQLLDEGRIDAEAKPYVHVAIERQLHPKVLWSNQRRRILLAARRVVDAA